MPEDKLTKLEIVLGFVTLGVALTIYTLIYMVMTDFVFDAFWTLAAV